MAGEIDLTAVAVYAALINVSGAGTTYAYSATHSSLADVPSGAIIATSPALTGKLLNDDASFDSDDPTFSPVVTGQSIEALILYADDGTSTYLIMYQDTGVTGLPLTPDGSDVQITRRCRGLVRPLSAQAPQQHRTDRSRLRAAFCIFWRTQNGSFDLRRGAAAPARPRGRLHQSSVRSRRPDEFRHHDLRLPQVREAERDGGRRADDEARRGEGDLSRQVLECAALRRTARRRRLQRLRLRREFWDRSHRQGPAPGRRPAGQHQCRDRRGPPRRRQARPQGASSSRSTTSDWPSSSASRPGRCSARGGAAASPGSER